MNNIFFPFSAYRGTIFLSYSLTLLFLHKLSIYLSTYLIYAYLSTHEVFVLSGWISACHYFVSILSTPGLINISNYAFAPQGAEILLQIRKTFITYISYFNSELFGLAPWMAAVSSSRHNVGAKRPLQITCSSIRPFVCHNTYLIENFFFTYLNAYICMYNFYCRNATHTRTEIKIHVVSFYFAQFSLTKVIN